MSKEQQKVVVFTGGTSGLGLAALEQLISPPVSRHIIIGARSPSAFLLERLMTLRGSNESDINIIPLELSSISSIHEFATQILNDLHHPIDYLVLCAGVVVRPPRRTVMLPKSNGDEVEEEETLFVNTLSQAILIRLLLPKMSANGRIVFVGSALHSKAAREFNITPRTVSGALSGSNWKSMDAYAISKLVQMHLFFIVKDEIHRLGRVPDQDPTPEAAHWHPSVIAVSPGFVPDTGLGRERPWYARFAMKYLAVWVPFATSLQEGGNTIVKGILDQDLSTGAYISKRGIEQPAAECNDVDLRKQWREWLSERDVWPTNVD